jgi:hypothetical protein
MWEVVPFSAAVTPPPPPPVPWTFGAKTVGPRSSAATSASIPLPTNSAGDLLFFVFTTLDVSNTNDPGNPTLPGGWTTIDSTNLPGNFSADCHVTVAYKVSNGAEGASISVSWSLSQPFDFLMQTITPPPGKSAVFDTYAANSSPGREISHGSPTLSGLVTAQDLLLDVWVDAGGQNPYSLDPLMTLVYLENQGAGNTGNITVGTINVLSSTSALSYTETAGGLAVFRSLAVAYKAV